jgi:hypothetical protein
MIRLSVNDSGQYDDFWQQCGGQTDKSPPRGAETKDRIPGADRPTGLASGGQVVAKLEHPSRMVSNRCRALALERPFWPRQGQSPLQDEYP